MSELEINLTYFKVAQSRRCDVKARFSVEFPQLALEIRGWELLELGGNLVVNPPRSATYEGSTITAVLLRPGDLRDHVLAEAIALYEREYADA